MKKAFSMITAIFFIILLSVTAVNTLVSSKSAVSFASKAYVKEQAEILIDLAKSVALERALKSGDPSSDKGVYVANTKDEFCYPNSTDCYYKITIEYKKNKHSMLEADKNTITSLIIIESGEIFKGIADIRIVREYLISN